MSPEIRERLMCIYAEVDATIAAAKPRCDASGKCCRFTEYGHTLFLSMLEAEVLLESAPPFIKPVSRDTCPFQVDNLCTARSERPLGCRIYFCDPAFQEQQSPITERAIAQLKSLADEFQLSWNYAPLHHFLNESVRDCDEKMKNTNAESSRITLPLI